MGAKTAYLLFSTYSRCVTGIKLAMQIYRTQGLKGVSLNRRNGGMACTISILWFRTIMTASFHLITVLV